MAKKKVKKPSVELTLWDVCLSYPDLYEPKPYKGKIYYRTDVLMDSDHPQLGALREAIKSIKTEMWGKDKDEWPEATQNAGNKPLVFNGDNREDQAGYKGKKFCTPSTQTPVPVVDLKGKAFNAQLVKGGMFANVAVRVSGWGFDGDEGVSIYLQGVQIDSSKASLNFGGGKSVEQMFSKKKGKASDSDDEDEGEEDQDESEDQEDDEDDQPRSKKKKPARDADEDEDEDDQPRKKKKAKNFDEDEEE